MCIIPEYGGDLGTEPVVSSGRGLRGKLKGLLGSWATRSLAIGAVATAVDVSILLTCVHFFDLPNPVAAMAGVLVGSTLTFFLNRRFAFKAVQGEVGPQLLKFSVTTAIAMGIHAGVVWLLADHFGLEVVIAKFIADILVFSVGQLLVLRYVVFPEKQQATG